MMPTNRLLVLDADTPWIWNHFAALPAGWLAERCGPVSTGLSLRRWKAALKQDRVPVPGWTKMYGLSTALLARQVAARVRSNRPRAIVHTVPWTAGILRKFRDLPHVYRPHDHFRGYSWDTRRVDELELQLVTECRFTAPLSKAQVEDFRQLKGGPVHQVPMAVSAEFVKRLRGSSPPRPNDLPTGTRVVGCVGQISNSYDFDFCTALADLVGDVTFVFIGPIIEENAELRRRVDALLGRPNVKWLGPKPHDELPNYLQHFDVCLSPLQPSHHNDRRSPLRLYDYLATGKPVLSTNIAAARDHAPFIDVVSSPSEGATRIRSMLAADYEIDMSKRNAYVDANTWQARANEFVDLVDEFCN